MRKRLLSVLGLAFLAFTIWCAWTAYPHHLNPACDEVYKSCQITP